MTRTKKYQIPSLNNRRFIAKYICSRIVELYEVKEGKQIYVGDYASFSEVEELLG